VAEVELTLDTAVYADGDLLCQPAELQNVCVENFPSFIYNALILDYDDQGGAIELLFFRSNPGHLGTVNAGISIGDAQAEEIIGIVPVASGDWTDIGSQQIADPQFNPIKVRPTDGGTSVWVAGMAGAASTYTSGKMLVKVGVRKIE